MPVLHKYKNDSGVYLRTSIEGAYVTFQVYQSAARLLQEMGYKDGGNIGWNVVKPLWERGYVYTGKSGTTKQVEAHLKRNQTRGLAPKQNQALQDFFGKEERKSVDVPRDVYNILSEWHGGKYSEERAKRLIYQAEDEEYCSKSIRKFYQSPISISGVDTTGGSPAYEVTSKDQELRCVDVHQPNRNSDFIITLSGESGCKQGLFITDGNLSRWKLYGSGNNTTQSYQRDLFRGFPSLVNLLVDIPGYDLALDLWDFDRAANHTTPQTVLDCLQVDWQWCVDSIGKPDGTSRRIKGKVISTSQADYGTISTEEISRKIVFDQKETPAKEGDRVTFQFQRQDGIARGVGIEVVEDDRRHSSAEGGTKYGHLTKNHESPSSRADRGELRWLHGEILTLDRKKGHGYIITDSGKRHYFNISTLNDQGLSPSSAVRAVVSNDSQIQYVESDDSQQKKDSAQRERDDNSQVESEVETTSEDNEEQTTDDDEPIESQVETTEEDDDERTTDDDEQIESEVETAKENEDARATGDNDQPGSKQKRQLGWLRYINQFYGSLEIENSGKTVLFGVERLPIQSEEMERGMAFTFETYTQEDGRFRAKSLRRSPSEDRLEDPEDTEETPNQDDSSHTTEVLSEDVTEWVSEHSADAEQVLQPIRLASQFGTSASEYENSIEKFGKSSDFEAVSISLSESGDPVYRFSLEGGNSLTVTHFLSNERTTLDVQVSLTDSPTHFIRVVDEKFVRSSPENTSGLSADEKHEFILRHGDCVSTVTEYLESVR